MYSEIQNVEQLQREVRIEKEKEEARKLRRKNVLGPSEFLKKAISLDEEDVRLNRMLESLRELIVRTCVIDPPKLKIRCS